MSKFMHCLLFFQTMEFANSRDNIKDIDKTAKNKWKWDWVQDTTLESTIRKTKNDGLAWCCICNQSLKYGSSGKKALVKHVDSEQHIKAVNTVKTNYSITGTFF